MNIFTDDIAMTYMIAPIVGLSIFIIIKLFSHFKW